MMGYVGVEFHQKYVMGNGVKSLGEVGKDGWDFFRDLERSGN